MALGEMGRDEGHVLRTKGPPGGLQHQRLGRGAEGDWELGVLIPTWLGKSGIFMKLVLLMLAGFGNGWGQWLCQEEECSLEFVKSCAVIGVEAAELSMTTNLCCSCPKSLILQFYPSPRWL